MKKEAGNEKKVWSKLEIVALPASSRSDGLRGCRDDGDKNYGPSDINPRPFSRTSRAGARHREGLTTS
jgi:hypothetical protein